MKNANHAFPQSSESFRIVPVMQTDGQAMKIPVQMTENLPPVDSRGRVLHIVIERNAFCAWRSNSPRR